MRSNPYASFSLILCILAFQQAFPGQELVQNPGFEAPGSAAPQGWFRDLKQTGKEGTVSLDTMRVRSGRASLRLEPNERNGASHPLAIAQIISAGAYRGKRVTFSGYLMAEGGATAALGVMSVVRKRISNLVLVSQPSGADWTLQQNTYDVPDDTSAQLILTCFVTGRSGSAWFDDISIVPGSGPRTSEKAPPRPSLSGHTAEGRLSATVELNAGAIVRQIPRTLFGTNVEWIWNGNFMWDEAARRVNPEFLRLARELGVSLVRYPGGHYSDYYHWKDGVGPFDRRPEVAHEPGKTDRSRPNLGTDEMLELARELNGELLMTVNAGSGTAQEAADWVRYVSNKTPPVRYWEVGNELYINDGSAMSKATTLGPEAYAARFREFARAMRAADPRIQVGAIGGVNQGRYSFVNYPDWDRIVLERAGDQIDFLAVHNAYAPGLFYGEQQDVKAVYQGMLGAPQLIANNLDQVAHDIASYAHDRASHIKIAVTEWGPLFQFDPRSRYVEHTKTLGSAVFAASTLKTFIESPQTEIANFFLLNDVTVMGWIGSRDGRFPPNPQWAATARGDAFQLFTKHFGQQLVRSQTTGPTFDTQPVGLWGAASNVPYLDVVSSLSSDGRSLYIIGVNKHFDRPIEADIKIRGYQPASDGLAWTLAGGSIDANTGTTPLRLPGMSWGIQAGDQGRPFSKGSPSEIVLSSSLLNQVAQDFRYTFPPLSVTSLELKRRQE